uniref:Cytochrome P450 16 n=1 Tax=Streltzoviella insularis TaxID=1206366 RepID=A0A7D5YP26_9NEOP|nr:cytochrome P450 16 [Streltzoviella insularis]
MPVIGTIGPKENFYEIAEYLYKNFGPIVKLDGLLARANMVILYDPDLYEQIFRAEEVNPLRPGFATVVYFREEMKKSTFDGVYGLTTAQGSKWRDFRTKVNPALLKPKLVKLYTPGLDDIARDMVAR